MDSDPPPLPGSARLADLGWHLPCRTIPSPNTIAPGCLTESQILVEIQGPSPTTARLFQPGHLQGGAVAGEGDGGTQLIRLLYSASPLIA